MRSILTLALLALATPAAAVAVSGQANPNLAGQPVGTACCGGDSAPNQSPVLAASGFASGSVFRFAASGLTDGAGTGPTGPDGAYVFNMANYGLGVAPAAGVTVLALVGVFLDSTIPVSASQPAGLDFSAGRDFTSLSPGLGQIFFIGDGLTATGTGSVQSFTAPTGATRLFLGTVDGVEWNNNSGEYNVNVSIADPNTVAEPTSLALSLLGVGALAAARRRR